MHISSVPPRNPIFTTFLYSYDSLYFRFLNINSPKLLCVYLGRESHYFISHPTNKLSLLFLILCSIVIYIFYVITCNIFYVNGQYITILLVCLLCKNVYAYFVLFYFKRSTRSTVSINPRFYLIFCTYFSNTYLLILFIPMWDIRPQCLFSTDDGLEQSPELHP